MDPDPLEQHPCVPLLRRAARESVRRVPAGLHPATRSFLMAEVARAYPPGAKAIASTRHIGWWRWAFAGPAFALLVAVAFFWAGLREENRPLPLPLTPTGVPAEIPGAVEPVMRKRIPDLAMAAKDADRAPAAVATPLAETASAAEAPVPVAPMAAPVLGREAGVESRASRAAPMIASGLSEREKSAPVTVWRFRVDPSGRPDLAGRARRDHSFLRQFVLTTGAATARITDADGSIYEGPAGRPGEPFLLSGTSLPLGKAIRIEARFTSPTGSAPHAGYADAKSGSGAPTLSLRIDLGEAAPLRLHAIGEPARD